MSAGALMHLRGRSARGDVRERADRDTEVVPRHLAGQVDARQTALRRTSLVRANARRFPRHSRVAAGNEPMILVIGALPG